MSYILTDTIDVMIVGEYENPEDAVRIVGGLMILHGTKMAISRYVLSEQPDKKGRAKVVYSANEMYKRALVYYNHNTYNKRQEKMRGY